MSGQIPRFLRDDNIASYAAARQAGVTPAEWRWAAGLPDVERPRRGVLAASSSDAPLVTALAAAQAMVPTAVVSHQSAAHLHRLALLRPIDRQPTLTVPKKPGSTPWDEVEVRFLVSALPADHVTTVGGLRVTTVARTCLDLARTTEFRDGLVVTDFALRAGLDPAELETAAKEMHGWPGTRTIRRVLGLADARRESPLESFGAAVWAENDLPPSEPQMWIYDREGFVARVDELWEEQQTVGEADGMVKYQGPYEPSANPLVTEKIRQERLERSGLAVVRYGSTDLWRHPGETVDRVRETFRRGRLLTPRFLASPVQMSWSEFRRAWNVRFGQHFDW
jgi:hypothetical protein